MILRGFHVDGFGPLRDLRCDDLVPGLNLVVGPNEAGKSTLHAFLRGVLFGFPDGRSREPSYEPWHGGLHGGRLRVRTGEGDFTIERHAGRRVKVRAPDGTIGGQELLDRLTGGADGRLYRGVFAFGLSELAGLEALAAEEVAARIFDAGLAGEGRAAAEAIAALAGKRGRELSPRGGRLRELARELDRAENELVAAVERSRGHGALLAELDRRREALAAARRQLEERRAESRRYALLRSLWPHELAAREARAVLAAAGEVAPVAPDALARFDAAHEAHRAAVEALARKDEALAGLRAEWRLLEGAPGGERPPPPGAAPSAPRPGAARAARPDGGKQPVPGAGVSGAPGRPRTVAGVALALAVALGLGALGTAATAGPGAAAGWAVAALLAFGLAFWARGTWAGAERSQIEDLARLQAAASLAGRIAAAEEERARLAAAVGAAAARVAAVRAETGVTDREALVLRWERWSRVVAARESLAAARRGIALALGDSASPGEWADAAGADAPGGPGEPDEEGKSRAKAGANPRTPASGEPGDERDVRTGSAANSRRTPATGDPGETAEAPAGSAASLRRALATGDPAAWARDQARADEEVARLSTVVEEHAAAVGALERERTELEASTDVPRLAAAVAERAAEVARAVRRYREAALLERLLRDALEGYQRERQPAVLRRAGEAFARITAGRYREVLQRAPLPVSGELEPVSGPANRDGGEPARGKPGRPLPRGTDARSFALDVLDRDGRCLPVEVLSRGTREQLYVCVRLGLAGTMAERGIRLPLLLDDVLVNFDPARAAATASVLAHFARDHQVLVFTCQPSTEALLAAAAPEAPVLHLPA